MLFPITCHTLLPLEVTDKDTWPSEIAVSEENQASPTWVRTVSWSSSSVQGLSSKVTSVSSPSWILLAHPIPWFVFPHTAHAPLQDDPQHCLIGRPEQLGCELRVSFPVPPNGPTEEVLCQHNLKDTFTATAVTGTASMFVMCKTLQASFCP